MHSKRAASASNWCVSSAASMFSIVGELVGDANIIVSLILIVIFSLLVSMMLWLWGGVERAFSNLEIK
jgi:hypothetical protein